MTNRRLGTALRRWWAVMLVCALAGGVGGLLAAGAQSKQYTATAAVSVTPDGVQDAVQLSSGRTAGSVNMDTESQVAASKAVAQAVHVLDRSTRGRSLTDLLASVNVAVPANTSVLDISFTAPNAQRAARLANDFANAYLKSRYDAAQSVLNLKAAKTKTAINLVTTQARVITAQLTRAKGSPQEAELKNQHQSLMRQLSGLYARVTDLSTRTITPGTVLSKATPPASPSKPVRLIWVAGGVALGLLIGIAVAYRLAGKRLRLRRGRDVAAELELPVLSTISDGRRSSPEIIAQDGRRLFNVVDASLQRPGVVVVTGAGTELATAALSDALAAAAHLAGNAAMTATVETALDRVSHRRLPDSYLFVAGDLHVDPIAVQAVAGHCDAVLVLVERGSHLRPNRELLNDLDAVGAPILGAVLVPSHSWWRRIFGGARHGQGKPPTAADRTEPVAAPRAAESEPSSGHVQLTP